MNINKSGIWKEDYPEFPIIRSYDKSKVYYDDEEIFSGVYNRENFFFEVDPFEIDSLDKLHTRVLEFSWRFLFCRYPTRVSSRITCTEG